MHPVQHTVITQHNSPSKRLKLLPNCSRPLRPLANMSTRAALLLAALAVLCAEAAASNRRMLATNIEGGTWVKNSEGEDIYVNPPQKADECSNVAPDQRYTCDQQKDFGACEKDFIKDGNYCLYTCGRCPSNSGGDNESKGDEGGDDKGGFDAPGNPTVCDDIAPNAEFTCKQQRDFGKCREWYIVDNHFCAQTCGLAPCPAAANLPVRNGTSTSISRRNATMINGTTTTIGTAPLDATNATMMPTPILTPVVPATVPATINTVPPISDALSTNLANATEPVAADANTTVAPLEPTVVPAAELPVETPTVPPTEPVAVVPAVVTTAPVLAPAVTEPEVSPAIDATAVAPNFTEPIASPAVDAANMTALNESGLLNATALNATALNATGLLNATMANVTNATVEEVAPAASPAVAAP